MPSNELFDPMFTTPAMSGAVCADAWLKAMLRFETALATAEARAGVIPADAAARVSAFCTSVQLDAGEIGRNAVAAANPAGPFVEALVAAAPGDVAPFLHCGATSQDVLDTAMMLVNRNACAVLASSLDRLAAANADLAERHRNTVMLGRTLMQPAVPITFGLKAAGWLSAAVDANEALQHWRRTGLALQLGGAAGTLASLGDSGAKVADLLGKELDLPVPALPWHTARGRIVRLATALAECAGVAGKVGLDVILLAQGEIGEVGEGGPDGHGRSSAMPHKRNPAASVVVQACVRRANGLLPALVGGMAQEHERAAGAWQAEWPTVCELFELTDAAVSGAADVLENLQVDGARMLQNLHGQGGLPMAEAVVAALSKTMKATDARAAVEGAIARSAKTGVSFADELAADAGITSALGVSGIEHAMGPGNYLGAANQFIDRALGAWRGAAN